MKSTLQWGENMEKRIYTVATAHLDTSWLWTLEDTITQYIPNTLHRNFELLEKFPEYVFSFEGSYRYELMEEYYPEDFERLKGYIAQGRWAPNGSCYENGDVNMPSPEALTRNILYGNGYFREKFGVESNDIFLPDCFGFGRALPSVAAHSGLKGFSTQKLTWGGAADVPFDVGRWQGSDGQQIWAALKTDAYNTQLKGARDHKVASVNVDESSRKYDFGRTMLYYGVGDRGGSPTEASVAQAAKEQRENDAHEVKVVNATSTQFFDDLEALPEEQKAKMPVWDGELLLTAHGTGSYTARAVSNRWNRRGELLADAAERSAVTAHVLGLADYPQAKLDAAWKQIIAHQFHDDITGTSFMECYRRNWNDYVLAMNAFSTEYTAATAAVAARMDTSFAVGIPVIVSNPVQGSGDRTEAVCIELPKKMRGQYYRVFDADGAEMPSQMASGEKGKRTVVFLAAVPSCGWKAYALRASDSPCPIASDMSISEKSIENRNLIVSIDDNGDISSIFDKRLQRELLSAPVRMAVIPDEHSDMWPSWEIQYEDVMAKPRGFAGKPQIRIIENGSARCALEIVRTCEKSTYRQVLSLDAASDYLRVDNETDWRTEASMLKAVFPLASENVYANYDTGLGSVARPTNTPRLYEVPAQRWADITDQSGEFGVAVFSDSRTGWDKPDRRTLRLTCVHTPLANCRWECCQHLLDIGLNRYSFGIGGHAGGTDGVSAQADHFNQPMHAFFTEKHAGELGDRYSLLNVSNDAVRVLALKKAQASDEVILRVVETAGKPQNVEIRFAVPLTGAREVRGDEMPLADFELTDGKMVFELGKNQIRSFALKFAEVEADKPVQAAIELPYNAVAVTANAERAASTLPGGLSIPAELTPETLLSGGIAYTLKKSGNSAVVCQGQEISLEPGMAAVHLLLTSLKGDKAVKFRAGEKETSVTVQDCFERVGAWDLVGLGETGWIKRNPQAWTIPHTHSAEGDMVAKQFYLFHAAIQTHGAQSIILPDDPDVLVFAATGVQAAPQIVPADAHFDRLEKRPFDYEFSAYAQKMMKPKWFERILDKFTDRTKPMEIKVGSMYMIEAKADLYWMAGMALGKRGRKKRIRELQQEWAENK